MVHPTAADARTDPLNVEGLRTQYMTRRGTVKAVDGVDLVVRRGTCVALVGESGSGKSQTALSIVGLVKPPGRILPDSSVRFNGSELVGMTPRALRQVRGTGIGMIYQEPRGSLNPVYTIGDQLTEVLRVRMGLRRPDAKAKAMEVLRRVGVPEAEERARQYPHQLSGGLCQRVAIGLALAMRPALLIADEPTTALDVTIQRGILELLRTLKDETGMAILLITHDLKVIKDIADTTYIMYAGQVVESGATRSLLAAPKHPYTRALLGAASLTPDSGGHVAAIAGRVPDASDFPAGCRFRPRCPVAFSKCIEPPPLRGIGKGAEWRCWLGKDDSPLADVTNGVEAHSDA